MKGKIPDLEYEAVKYLYQDYVVDNSKLKETGFENATLAGVSIGIILHLPHVTADRAVPYI